MAVVLPAIATVTVDWQGAADGEGSDLVQVSSVYDPHLSPEGPARESAEPQEGETWQGIAPIPDPAEVTGLYDIHEFDVLPGFDNDTMTVSIRWDPGPAFAFDLNLHVERLAGAGWDPVASSTNGQFMRLGTAEEVAVAASPSPGRYRARVHNFASHQIAYNGEIAFEGDGVIRNEPNQNEKVPRGRATEDRPDLTEEAQVHLIYFVPADGDDLALDTDGTLDASMTAVNQWFEAETGGRRMRMDTFTDKRGQLLDITFVRGLRTTAGYMADGTFSAVTSELEARGWNADPAEKRYLVYYEGPHATFSGVCGTARRDLRGLPAQWSMVFLGAHPLCGARDFGTPQVGGGKSEAIAVHEMLHNEGQVWHTALHHCAASAGHICTAQVGSPHPALPVDPEEIDVLFPAINFPLREKVLDRERDDYYEHPFPHPDVADSPYWWN